MAESPLFQWFALIVGVAFLGTIILGALKMSAAESRLRRGVTLGRRLLTAEEIYELYFEQPGYLKQEVLLLWREIADALEVDPGLLRPEDRFGDDIGGGFVLTPELDTLSEWAADRASAQGLDLNLQTIKTVSDYKNAFTRPQPRT